MNDFNPLPTTSSKVQKCAIGQQSALQDGKDIDRYAFVSQAMQRDHTAKLIPCKPLTNTKIVPRRPKIVPTSASQVIKYGYGRHHPKGLASLDIVPVNNALMPKADFFVPFYDNPLGQPA